MGMSWTTALDDQSKSLESLLARRALEERALMEIAQQAEVQRRNRATEELDARQLDESRRWREANQASLDEQRAAAAAENRAQAEAIAAARAEQERILNDPNADPQLKAAIAFKRAGVTPAAGVQTGNDAGAMMERVNAQTAAALERVNTNNSAQMARTLAIIAGQNQRDANNPSKGGEDPELSGKVQEYLATLPQKIDPATGEPYTLQRARAELQRQFPNLRAANPALSLSKANKALTEMFAQPSDNTMMTPNAEEMGISVPSSPSPGVVAPQRKPIPGIPGGEAELRNGRWIRVK